MNRESKAKGSGRTKWIALGVLTVLVAGAGGVFCVMRGPSGATTAIGGSIPAKDTPELPDGADRWVNGAPVTMAASRGQVVLVEGWHPA